MAIVFIGVEPSGQVTRGCVRVVLAGGFALSDLLSGPLTDLDTWPAKIDQWRDGVTTADFPVPASTSLPAIAESGYVTPESRAVVDVMILGAEFGTSYGNVAAVMDTLTPRVDVLSIQKILTITDDTGRGKALQDALARAAEESWSEKILRTIRKSLVIVGIGAALLLLVVYYTRRKS